MVLDNIKNSISHLYERIKSPFGGTFITVWVIHHWQLVYSFFTFDQECTLNDRLTILNHYLSKENINTLLCTPLGFTFLAIILFSILNYIGYGIMVFFHKWAKPSIHYVVDRNKNATQEEVLRLKRQLRVSHEELENAQNEAQESIELKRKAEQQVNDLQSNLGNAIAIQSENALKRDQLLKENQTLNSKLETLRVDAVDKEEQIIKMREEINGEHLNYINPIFEGRWQNSFTFKNGSKGSELFTMNQFNHYIIGNKPTFIIEDIFFHEKKRYLSFTKVKLDDKSKRVPNNLIQISDNLYIGYEPDGTTVRYEKLSN